MELLAGKTAVISGGAHGIGLSIARALGGAGMNLVIADIEPQQLAAAQEELEQAGFAVLPVEMDVASSDDWSRTATLAEEQFGDVHMLVNNAGVAGGFGPLEDFDPADWQWAIDVNLLGVVHGAHALLPLLSRSEGPSWLINVASIAGMAGAPMAGAYTATKAAVVALSEAWAEELADRDIRVSVLAPAFVQTRIHQSHRNRQARYASDGQPSAAVEQVARGTAEAVAKGIDVDIVGQRVVEALAAGEFYIFTHPAYRAVTDSRAEAIAGAFERAAASPILANVDDGEIQTFTGS